MSLDKSLKSKSALERHRNVLTRAERIAKLEEEGRWTDNSSPTGLPKVAHRKSTAGAKEKKEKKETTTEESTETAADEKK